MGSGVVAVLTAYWPERFKNLYLQIGDLLSCSVRPDKILVFNNNPNHKLPELPDYEKIITIESSGNFHSRSKYAVAMLEPSPYYMLLDDDLSVSSTDIEQYLKYACPGFALCDWGVQFKDSNFISQGRGFYSRMVKDLRPCNSFIGRGQFVSFGAIVKLLEAEEKVRLPNLPLYRTVAEDILIALCNPAAFICPGIRPVELDTYGVAMENDEGYQAFRDIFAFDAMRILSLPQKPGPAPGPTEREMAERYLQTAADRDRVSLRIDT